MGKLRILFVEDHDDTVRIIRKVLERDGHQLTCASSVAEAIAFAKTATFDLAIIDGKLPDGRGWELFVELQAIQRIPGIAVTAYGMKADVQRSKDAGFCLHLTKPVDIPVLRRAIEKCAEGKCKFDEPV
jgi:CheY-like chemotaxis protein